MTVVFRQRGDHGFDHGTPAPAASVDRPPAPAHRSSAVPAVILHDVPEAAQADWTALIADHAVSIYQTWGFNAAWWASHADAGQPLVAVARHGERPVLVLPLVVRDGVARLPGGRHLNLGLPLVDAGLAPEVRQSVMDAVMAALRKRGISLVILHNVVPEALGAVPALPSGLHIRTDWFFEGTLLDDYSRLLRERRGKKTKGKLKRKFNRLNEAEGFAIRRITDRTEGEAVVDVLIAQKLARFSRRHIRTGFDDPRFRDFCLRLLETGVLQLDVMFVKDRPLAIYGGGEAGGRYSAFFSSIDENSPLLKYGPGEVLLAHIVADSCARGLKVLDLGVGEMAYKSAWCNRRLPVMTVLVPLNLRGWILALPRAAWLRLRPHVKRLVMRHSALRRLAEQLLARGIG